jgi:hypothetical protein
MSGSMAPNTTGDPSRVTLTEVTDGVPPPGLGVELLRRSAHRRGAPDPTPIEANDASAGPA